MTLRSTLGSRFTYPCQDRKCTLCYCSDSDCRTCGGYGADPKPLERVWAIRELALDLLDRAPRIQEWVYPGLYSSLDALIEGGGALEPIRTLNLVRYALFQRKSMARPEGPGQRPDVGATALVA